MTSPEARDNLIKAKERLSAAKLLFESSLYEDAVSRAYCAALYAVRAALLSEKLVAKSHDGAILLFGSHFVKTGRAPRSLASDLAKLRRMREKAEYSTAFKTTETDASWALEAAERLVAELKKLA